MFIHLEFIMFIDIIMKTFINWTINIVVLRGL